ncbi:S1/P1 nuclease [Sphingomonas immobilis]|uniref:S1/P1 nuclease n=1 Tax=Sphingomonas immobilis TaxID=3063997 RepID=A0ABT9A3F1_9SPHN|nr:S1/P1 nuclease [Sphingomonas sp. CA1-15]MDO7843947.1 S1/P1 nuclease [Sphingomonas sp. CA1-15]
MIRALLPAAAVALAATASPAAAYWEFGHETVAKIAYANITPKARAGVRRLLAQSRLLGTPECKADTIESASVWADCIKPLKDANGQSRFGYAFSWHYQNVDICHDFDLTPACKDGNCVSTQIERDVKLLRDRATPAKERVMALAFLIHFVGDLHQPLHAGDKTDKGGNDVKAGYGDYAPPRLNLHSIWDGLLAERAITTGPSLVRRYPAAVRAKVAAGSVTDWSRESWQVAHDVAYTAALGGDPCVPTPPHVELDNATIAKLVPAAKLEVERGGLRLARLLDEALG